MLHIKLKGMMHAATWGAHILPADPPTLGVGSKGKYSTFLEQGHVAYQIKWNHRCSSIIANNLPAGTPTPTVGVGSKTNSFRIRSCCISN